MSTNNVLIPYYTILEEGQPDPFVGRIYDFGQAPPTDGRYTRTNLRYLPMIVDTKTGDVYLPVRKSGYADTFYERNNDIPTTGKIIAEELQDLAEKARSQLKWVSESKHEYDFTLNCVGSRTLSGNKIELYLVKVEVLYRDLDLVNYLLEPGVTLKKLTFNKNGSKEFPVTVDGEPLYGVLGFTSHPVLKAANAAKEKFTTAKSVVVKVDFKKNRA